MTDTDYTLWPVGHVESPLTDRRSAPPQADEGAPEAWLVLQPHYAPAMRDLDIGERIIVLTWLDRGDRTVLGLRPRDDPTRPLRGVFSTRSPDRPNPVGLHEVDIVQIDGTRIQVRSFEAIDGTPIIDIKPVLGPPPTR
jgi:tRNA-Thr(GGU) m(6)t(6)A37 methyltransferase TsaA